MAEIGLLADEQIDTSEIPELDQTFFATARLGLLPGATNTSVQIPAPAADAWSAVSATCEQGHLSLAENYGVGRARWILTIIV